MDFKNSSFFGEKKYLKQSKARLELLCEGKSDYEKAEKNRFLKSIFQNQLYTYYNYIYKK